MFMLFFEGFLCVIFLIILRKSTPPLWRMQRVRQFFVYTNRHWKVKSPKLAPSSIAFVFSTGVIFA